MAGLNSRNLSQNLKFVPKFLFPNSMKTASLGLLEVMVVRVNAGGDAPPEPPLLVTSDQGHLSLFSSRKDFWRMSRILFLARALRIITRNHIKP